MIKGVEYVRHIPKTMLANRFAVQFSAVSIFKEGDHVYQIRDKGDMLLIGHTFHSSLLFDREKLECWSNDGSKLLAKVVRIK